MELSCMFIILRNFESFAAKIVYVRHIQLQSGPTPSPCRSLNERNDHDRMTEQYRIILTLLVVTPIQLSSANSKMSWNVALEESY